MTGAKRLLTNFSAIYVRYRTYQNNFEAIPCHDGGFTAGRSVSLLNHAVFGSGNTPGRLRTKWIEVHADEVYFRDTTHGFLTWAGGVRAGASVAGSVATVATAGAAAAAAVDSGSMGYLIDFQFRKDLSATATAPSGSAVLSGATAQQTDTASVSEMAHIFMNTLRTGASPAEDVRYTGQLVVQRTGLTQQKAESGQRLVCRIRKIAINRKKGNNLFPKFARN